MKSKTSESGHAAFPLVPSTPIALTEKIDEHDREYYAKNAEAHVYKDESEQTMPYRLFIPRGYNPRNRYPLVLSLHGAGERGHDNLKQLVPWVAGWMTEEVQSKHPCLILMPQCPADQQWVDTPWAKGSYAYLKIPVSKPMKLARMILDKVIQDKSVDRSRIYVMGASMGGYGAWDFVMRCPELVAAAVPVCGGGDPAMAHVIREVPIWAFHGDKDTTVPTSGSQDMADAIKEAGGTRIKLTLYEGVGHGSYLKAWREKKLVEWIFNQARIDNKPDAGDGK
ncbi:MAG: dienelactone hydrolase family protein [Kiritimatiellia bacterium]|jgi:predicted peptidase